VADRPCRLQAHLDPSGWLACWPEHQPSLIVVTSATMADEGAGAKPSAHPSERTGIRGRSRPFDGSRRWTRNFTLFFVARAVARLGDVMSPVALAIGLVLHGHGVEAVGAAMASYWGGFAGFVIIGGVLADRWDTRKLMVSADLVRVGTQAVTAGLFFAGTVVPWQICAIGLANGLCAALFQPGVASTVPRIATDVQGANAAIRSAESVASVAGPALAAVFIGITSVGGVFAAHALIYVVSAACLVGLRLPGDAMPAKRTGAFRRDLVEGWREFRARTWLWGVITIWMVFMVTAFGPAIPLVATEIITTHGAGGYGWIMSGNGLGMAVGGLLALRLRPRFPLRAGAIALTAFCLQPLTVGLQLPVTVIAVGFVFSGVVQTFWAVMWATSVQTHVPGRVLNRIHAYEVAGSLAMMPVGQVIAGPAAALFGASHTLLLCATLTAVCCAALVAVPAVRDLGRAEPAGSR
jgi:MFS family permease